MKLKDKLAGFEDIVIQDSTVIRLHKNLANKWPATRTKKIAAGVKVSLLVSAVADGPKRVALCGERTSDIKTLRIGPWVRDRILLIDLGFYKHHTFVRIDENGGFFVSRLKGRIDPIIVGTNRTWRGRSKNVVGERLSEVLPKLKRQVLDVEVDIEFKRRKYNGKQRNETKRQGKCLLILRSRSSQPKGIPVPRPANGSGPTVKGRYSLFIVHIS